MPVDLKELRQKIREFREKHAGKCVWSYRTEADSWRLELEENPPKWVNCKIVNGRVTGSMDVWEL